MRQISPAKTFFLQQTVFWCVLVAILYGLLRPQSPPDLFYQSDKWMHLLAFSALAFCAGVAFCSKLGWRVWAVLLFVAPVLEWVQHWVQPHRTFSWEDAFSNIGGVVLGWLAFWILIRR
ncbi:MAG: VanZ family protein [Oceanospirillales bacterium]|nr:VanZ family protein [Oceanospirillales bacterium]